jgi:hypothetical protein
MGLSLPVGTIRWCPGMAETRGSSPSKPRVTALRADPIPPGGRKRPRPASLLAVRRPAWSTTDHPPQLIHYTTASRMTSPNDFTIFYRTLPIFRAMIRFLPVVGKLVIGLIMMIEWITRSDVRVAFGVAGSRGGPHGPVHLSLHGVVFSPGVRGRPEIWHGVGFGTGGWYHDGAYGRMGWEQPVPDSRPGVVEEGPAAILGRAPNINGGVRVQCQ